jgi:hypothetical protein
MPASVKLETIRLVNDWSCELHVRKADDNGSISTWTTKSGCMRDAFEGACRSSMDSRVLSMRECESGEHVLRTASGALIPSLQHVLGLLADNRRPETYAERQLCAWLDLTSSSLQ